MSVKANVTVPLGSGRPADRDGSDVALTRAISPRSLRGPAHGPASIDAFSRIYSA